MHRRLWLWTLAAFASVVVLLGLALTALLLCSEQFSSAVLCSDPEDFACSGHYVYGVANEVWSVALTLLGTALLVASIILIRRAARTAIPRA